MIENPKDITSHGHIVTGLLIAKTFNQENPEKIIPNHINDFQILSYDLSNILKRFCSNHTLGEQKRGWLSSCGRLDYTSLRGTDLWVSLQF